MFRITRFILILFISVSSSVFALPEDSQAKLYIVADSSSYNDKTGVSVFIGHIKIDQGTTHLTADRLVTKNDSKHRIAEAIAYGLEQPATFKITTKTGDPEIQAQAKIIKFYPLNANVILEQEVFIKQGENSFEGQIILYNRNEQTVIIPSSKSGHAELVYNPDKNDSSFH